MLLNKSEKNLQSGQALIIILLAMSVALTLVLSSVSRSITDVGITDQEEESLRAFSAAEAGVEEALLRISQGSTSDDDIDGSFDDAQTETSYDVSFDQGSVGRFYEHPRSLGPGESATFWLVGHDGGNLTCDGDVCTRTNIIKVCFGKGSYAGDLPALEVQMYYDETQQAVNSDDFSNVKVETFAFDANRTRTANNGFDNARACNEDMGSNYTYRIEHLNNELPGCSNTSGCLLAVKVKPLYTSLPVPVALRAEGGSANLPAQGVVINSEGVSGESTRRLKVEYNFSSIPGMFDNTLFGGAHLTK